MQHCRDESADVLSIATLYLQDISRRPTVSNVVKMPEKLVALENISDCDLPNPFNLDVTQADGETSSPLIDSVLSGQR